ncbi:MAG: sensor histidine kinase, partial [Slackia piriformis]|nr:sensor histidine kinase [Slackia piriformis]
MKRTGAEGMYFAFVDAAVFDTWKPIALRIALAGLGILAALLVVNIFFARWALRPVEQAWNTQRQFVADASHELKTPLTVILANASILARHPEKTVEEQLQ